MKDIGAFVDAMLMSDSLVRYVAVISDDYRVLASKQRKGVPSYASEEVERNFMSIVPQIITESVEKLAPFLGTVRGITAHYDKALLVLYQFENMIIVLTFQPEVAAPFYNRITEEFKKNSAQYLT